MSKKSEVVGTEAKPATPESDAEVPASVEPAVAVEVQTVRASTGVALGNVDQTSIFLRPDFPF